MAEHYTKDTVEVRRWCAKCSAFTMHHVYGGRLAGCQACIKSQEAVPKKPEPAIQERLF